MSRGGSEDGILRRCLIQDKRRLSEVADKQDRVRSLLHANSADALLLQDPANIAWFTSGTEISRFATDSCQTSLFVTDDARLFATNAVDSAQLFEREVFGLGFQLKQREWFQPHAALLEDLCRGRRVVSDSGFEGTRCIAKKVAALRLPLSDVEVERLRRLSRVVVHAVEVTAGRIRRGVTESAVAGELSHRLLRRTVTPVRIQVCADGRNERYRHWPFGEDIISSYATVSCVARRWGLHVGVSRTVCLDNVPPDLWAAHQRAVLLHATGMYFSRHAQPLKSLWPKVHRIYEKFGLGSEWQLGDQADIIGYRASEHPLTPGSEWELQAPTPMFWHPGVQAASPGDTVLVTPRGCEILTRSSVWPELRVQVKGRDVPCPGLLLIRDQDRKVEDAQAEPETGKDSLFLGFGVPEDDQDGSRMDTIWELDLSSTGRSVFEEMESPFPEESVLD